MTYQPRPIPTDKVILPDSLDAIIEQLAESTHDVWARQRLAEGWNYGPKRDDAQKKHPCLVPYADLPESEKEYDRKTAMETLKAIVALGYGINPRAAGYTVSGGPGTTQDDGPADLLRLPGRPRLRPRRGAGTLADTPRESTVLVTRTGSLSRPWRSDPQAGRAVARLRRPVRGFGVLSR